MLGKKNRQISVVMSLALLATGAMFSGGAFAVDESVMVYERIEPFRLISVVESVDTANALMMVGEKRVHLSFTVGGKQYKASLRDSAGKDIERFQFVKGQRVLVQGVQLPDGEVVAGLVQKTREK